MLAARIACVHQLNEFPWGLHRPACAFFGAPDSPCAPTCRISLGMSYSTFTAIFNNIVPGYVLRTLYPVPSLLESSAYGFGIHQPSAAAGNENQSHWRHAVPSKKFRTTRPAGADPHAEEPTPHSRHLRAVQL
eukprot:365930-Chlamydomonas_euryale.AAC.7